MMSRCVTDDHWPRGNLPHDSLVLQVAAKHNRDHVGIYPTAVRSALFIAVMPSASGDDRTRKRTLLPVIGGGFSWLTWIGF